MTEEEICELYLNPDKGNNYISKDKIRDKIEKYRKLEEKSLTRETYFIFKNIIYVLERLLEE